MHETAPTPPQSLGGVTGDARHAATRRSGVLFVGNFLAPRAASRPIGQDLTQRLAARGWRVLCTSNKQQPVLRLADMLATAWRRRQEYAVVQVDVFSGRAFLWAEAVSAILRRLRKPFVLTLHGGNLPAFARRWPGRVSRLLNGASAVTAPSSYLARAMRAYRPDVNVLPNSIDVDAYPFRLRDRPAARLVWLRAFHAVYEPQLAAEVLALLRARCPDAHLVMAGPIRCARSFRDTVEVAVRRGAHTRMTLLGPIPKAEVPVFLQAGDIFLNTARVDNAPVTVLEAMACGLCVVTTDVGGIPHMLEDGSDALFVQRSNPVAMAAAVERVLREPGLAGQLSQRARRKAETFDWHAIADRWDTLLLEQLRDGAAT